MASAVAAAVLPRIGVAQPAGMPSVALLYSQSADAIAPRLDAFRKGLADGGFIEGETVAIVYRFAENRFDRLAELANDLVQRRVAVIAAGNPISALAVKAATRTVPVVFTVNEDPVHLGLVGSIAHPDANMTGINYLSAELAAKRLAFLRELVPSAARLAVLINPANPTNAETTTRDMTAAAASSGVDVRFVPASSSGDIDVAFAALASGRPDALFIGNDGLFTNRRVQLVHLATRHGFPAVYSSREYTEIGGLLSYGADIPAAWREAGRYVGRILKGAKPGDLPIMQSSRFELVINNVAARILGLTVPQSLFAAANEIIE
jgi:putative ABC transport system substrate-binding protein